MSTAVKFLHSAMTGAPVLSGTAGALATVLDACLVDGFGLVTLDSLVIAGNVATMTRAAGHSFEAGCVALVAGATVTGGTINGEWRVIATTATTATFATTGLADQTATGSITAKVAPLGWTKPHNSTNLAAYKSANPAATGCLLRVDDTGGVNARVVGYESMGGINTDLVGPFPTAAQVSGGGYWAKSSTANATARPWVIVGDDRGFYISVATTSGAANSTHGFGDFLSNKSPDAYACVLSCSSSDIYNGAPGSSNGNDVAHIQPSTNAALYAARGVGGLGGAVALRRAAAVPGYDGSSAFSGSATGFMAYPNPADNGLYVSPIFLTEVSATTCYRGRYPGLLFCPQNVGTSVFSHKDIVTGVTGMEGKTLRALLNGSGPLFVDATGPWR